MFYVIFYIQFFIYSKILFLVKILSYKFNIKTKIYKGLILNFLYDHNRGEKGYENSKLL